MGKDYPIANIEITGRQGNDKGQTGHQILVCSDEKAANKSMPNTWGWEDCGSYPFVPGKNEPQLIDLSTKVPMARYIKVYIGEEFKGKGDYAMIAEMNVYTVK